MEQAFRPYPDLNIWKPYPPLYVWQAADISQLAERIQPVGLQHGSIDPGSFWFRNPIPFCVSAIHIPNRVSRTGGSMLKFPAPLTCLNHFLVVANLGSLEIPRTFHSPIGEAGEASRL